MSSSEKTEYLNLNAWLGTDRPQRIDFVDDNTIIDTAIKNHVQNATMHCTSTEKAKIDNPYTAISYVGTGDETNVITFAFTPKMVLVFQKDVPPIQTDSSGNILINKSVVVKSHGGIGGVIINGYDVTVTQSTTAEDGVIYNLNKLKGQYCIVGFK